MKRSTSTPDAGPAMGDEKRHKTSSDPPPTVTALKPKSFPRSAFVTLCIGDQRFKTSRATLALAGGMYFAALLSDRWHEGEEANLGCEEEVFIDRDPEPFGVILSFLRSGCKVLNVDETNKRLFVAVLVEADFYQIEVLTNMVKVSCQRNLCNKSTPPGETEE